MSTGQQFGRKANLIVVGSDDSGIDLSQMHFRFKVTASDEETPNNAEIRVYNLSADTVRRITGKTPVEYGRVVLQAGYEDATYGVIFDGTIKQFRKGRENATDSYLDILAAENDVEYNFGVCNTSVPAGSSPQDRVTAIAGQMGLPVGDVSLGSTGGVLPRGKVLWGMGRAAMRCEASTRLSSWSIQNGKVQVTSLTGYLPGEAVVLNAATGLIGLPEQTDDGIKMRCLLNPKLRIGGLVQLNNAAVNQTQAQASSALPAGQLPFNRRADVQFLADVTADGFYRLYVVEYSGDTRGQDWYCDLVGLAVDPSSKTVQAYG